MASSVLRRNLSEITEWEMPVTASKKRGKIYERNSRGYGSIMLNEELMDILNQDSGVRETLSNLVTSNFVFQEQNATSSKIQNSKTRYNYS